jgi:hypothetical protein
MENIQDITDAAMKLGLAPELRKSGYKKSGRTFHFVSDACTRVLNIQSDRWNTRTEGSFTINLGIYFPALHQLAERVPFPGLPKEYDCDVRERIGDLMPSQKDHWWNVNMNTNIEELADELRHVWQEYARPWLEHNSSLINAAMVLERTRQPFMAAAARLLLGDKEKARELTALALKQYPAALDDTRAWAQKHGLAV